jgi:hypothetical protein
MDPATQPPRAARQRISSTRIRAIYFITDTATWGVSTPQLTCVTKQINGMLPGGVVDSRACPAIKESKTRDFRVGLLQFPGCPSGERMKTLVLLGPTSIPRTHTGKVHRRNLAPLFEPHTACHGPSQILALAR